MKKRWPWITYGLVILFQIFLITYNKIKSDLNFESHLDCYESYDPETQWELIKSNSDSIQVLTLQLSELSQ